MLRKPSIRAVEGLVLIALTILLTALAVRQSAEKEYQEKYQEQISTYESDTEQLRAELVEVKNDRDVSADAYEAGIEDLSSQLESATENSGSVTLSYSFTRAEVDLLARLCQAEAGPENYESQRYILHVVLNRVASEEFPDTVEEVIYQNNGSVWQFSVAPNGMIDTEATDEVVWNIKSELLYQEVSIPSSVLYFHSERIDPKVNRRVYKRVEGTTFTY